MRILIPLLCFFLISKNSISQKGAWFAGGQFGFSNSSSNPNASANGITPGKVSKWNFSPEIGTFITQKSQVGAAISFGSEKNIQPSTSTFANNKLNSAGIKAYYRRFWGQDKFKPFGGSEIIFTTYKSSWSTSRTDFSNPITSSSFNINIILGFNYTLSPRVNALGSIGFLGFSRNTMKYPTTSPDQTDVRSVSNTFGFEANSLGNRFNIGFYYTFKKPKE